MQCRCPRKCNCAKCNNFEFKHFGVKWYAFLYRLLICDIVSVEDVFPPKIPQKLNANTRQNKFSENYAR